MERDIKSKRNITDCEKELILATIAIRSIKQYLNKKIMSDWYLERIMFTRYYYVITIDDQIEYFLTNDIVKQIFGIEEV